MKYINIIIPSRGRPDILSRLLESWAKTSNISISDITVVLDEDDQQNYPKFTSVRYVWYPGKRLNLVQKLNGEATEAAKNYPVVSFMGDDCVFHTPGWEQKIIEWQQKHHSICYCNDLLQEETLPNNVFIDSSIINALGFMAPRELNHYYIDNYWKDLGIRLRKIKYFPDVIIEHRHWSNSKAQKDETYNSAESLMGIDQKTWDNYRLEKLAMDVQNIEQFQLNNL